MDCRRSESRKFAGILVALLVSVALAAACSVPNGDFYQGAFNAGVPKLYATSVTAGVQTISVYGLDGQLIQVVADYTAANLSPRGLAPLDLFNFAVSLDGTDQIGAVNLLGEARSFVVNANLTGNLYHLRARSNGDLYVIETNTIEAFSLSGARLGNPRVATTIGACVLNVTRGMYISADDRLITVATGNDDINIYDISLASPTCLASNTTLAGTVDPIAVLLHSNGMIYVATLGDDRIYAFNGDGSGTGTVIFDNPAIILNPTAIVEMPDGTMLVASDGTNTIERIDVTGQRIGSSAFIQNGFTGSVGDLMIMPRDY